MFALETARDGVVSDSLAACIAQNLAQEGQYALTLASFDHNHEEKISRSLEQLQRRTVVALVVDLTAQARDFAAILYSAFLLGSWHERVKVRIADDAARTLHAIDSGAFNYTLVTGSSAAAPA